MRPLALALRCDVLMVETGEGEELKELEGENEEDEGESWEEDDVLVLVLALVALALALLYRNSASRRLRRSDTVTPGGRLNVGLLMRL